MKRFDWSRFLPCGLATGIGSLPFTDPGEALSVIVKYFPEIPHWPQLPRRGRIEDFVFQFLNPLIETGLIDPGPQSAFFKISTPAWPDYLTKFYSTCFCAEEGDLCALEAFAFPKDSAPGFFALLEEAGKGIPKGAGFLKGHLVGPLSAGFQLKDDRGRLAYYQDELRDLVVRTLAMHARWQAAALGRFGLPAIVFIDEPCIGACGSCHYITLKKEMIREDLDQIIRAIHVENAAAGVHSCSAADWTLLFDSDLEIVSLDAYRFGDSLLCYAGELDRFLLRGGIIAWGIVPTMEKAFDEDSASLFKRLESLWLELAGCGVSKERLITRSLISPSCGTGLLSCELAERIYRLTSEVSWKVGTRIKSSGL